MLEASPRTSLAKSNYASRKVERAKQQLQTSRTKLQRGLRVAPKRTLKVSLARQITMEERTAERQNRWNKSDTCTDSLILPVDRVKVCKKLPDRGNKVTTPRNPLKLSSRLLAARPSCIITMSGLICRMMVLSSSADLVRQPASREAS